MKIELRKINKFLSLFRLVMLVGVLIDDCGKAYAGGTEITIIRKKNIQKEEMFPEAVI